jgi:hypothetical protein
LAIFSAPAAVFAWPLIDMTESVKPVAVTSLVSCVSEIAGLIFGSAWVSTGWLAAITASVSIADDTPVAVVDWESDAETLAGITTSALLE